MGMQNRKALAGWKAGVRIKPKLDTGPGLTKQEFGKDADINVLMKRYGVTTIPVDLNNLTGVFGDVAAIGEYADVVRRINAAEDAFMQLAPEMRSLFGNDPALLVSFLQDERNRPDAERLGLVAKKVQPVAAVPAAKPPEGGGGAKPPVS